jgi:hypothetical protein
MERFLYRLSRTPHHEKFVLKGALMFVAWRAPRSRPTMDIDLLGRLHNDVAEITALMGEVCRQEVEPDGLHFDPQSLTGEVIAEHANYHGVRVLLRGSLGTARVTLQVDVGFGDVIVPSPTSIDYPTILDLPAPRIPGYSRESAVAEKFEAMTRLGVLNSRMKDFFDIWLLSGQFEFDGGTLAVAIDRTFAHRGTMIQSHPVALTSPFAEEPTKQAQWKAFVRRTRLDNTPESLSEVVPAVATFLGPVTDALVNGWSFREIWIPPGPWTTRPVDGR